MAYLHKGVMIEMRINAADYAKLIGKSKTTARNRLEKLVLEHKARKIFTYAEWSVSRCQGGRPSRGTVPAVDYLIFDESEKEG
jgi:hypothetical protein